jgi:hypothetical protein
MKTPFSYMRNSFSHSAQSAFLMEAAKNKAKVVPTLMPILAKSHSAESAAVPYSSRSQLETALVDCSESFDGAVSLAPSRGFWSLERARRRLRHWPLFRGRFVGCAR